MDCNAAIVAATADLAPEAWRRTLSFVLDGLRADPAHPLPALAADLESPALTHGHTL
jgi:hypothetical protein